MLLKPLNPLKTEELNERLSLISEQSGVMGYLVGLVQDTEKCIVNNLRDGIYDEIRDVNDLEEITESLHIVENLLGGMLATAILRAELENDK